MLSPTVLTPLNPHSPGGDSIRPEPLAAEAGPEELTATPKVVLKVWGSFPVAMGLGLDWAGKEWIQPY